MKNTLQLLALTIGTIHLFACSTIDQGSYTNYSPYSYDEIRYYHPNYDGSDYYSSETDPPAAVTVPETYHVGAYHSPVSHKDRDRAWVNSQNPQNYTIEIADHEKAAQVAGMLYQAPKNDRMGEIKYNRNGKAYYKGLYGSYTSFEDAQKALNNLPAELKQGANIKNWGKVQQAIGN